MSLSVSQSVSSGSVPLKSVNVSGEFCDSLGEVCVRQSWINETPGPITANYCFSLDMNAVINKFRMKIGNNFWEGKVEAKAVASEKYSAAVEDGTKSSLLEKLYGNSYRVKVGPVDSAERLEIEFSYLTRAEVKSDGAYCYVLPTNIAPKYTSSTTTNAVDLEYSAEMSSIPYAFEPGYSFEVDIKWSSGGAIQEVLSSTNAITTSVLSATSVRVQCSTAPVNGDFTLCVKSEAITAAYSYECPEDNCTYLYVHNRIPSEVTAVVPRKVSILIDRSGSMEGGRIEQAVKAVKQFVELLDSTNYINIVGFGTRYKALWPQPVPASTANKKVCLNMLKSCSANMGGTELLNCLRDVITDSVTNFSKSKVDVPIAEETTMEHVVVLLTDGEVDNVESIIAMLKQNVKDCRVMTIGIGASADRKLVQRVAESTNAICRMLVDETDLTPALADIVEYIQKQYYANVRVDNYEAVQCSRVLYPAHPLDMFLRLESQQMSEIVASGLTITAHNPVLKSEKAWTLSVSQCGHSSDLIQKLYVNGVIRQLEERLGDYTIDRAAVVKEIVDLSVKHNIMNSETSFLIVSDQTVSSTEPVVEQSVPHYTYSAPARYYASTMGCLGCVRKSAPANGGIYPPRKKRSYEKAVDSGEYIPRKTARQMTAEAEAEQQKSQPTVSAALVSLLKLQKKDGSFTYSAATAYRLLGYPSAALFTADVATSGLTATLYFDMCVLLRLELMGGAGADKAVEGLRAYLTDSVKYFARRHKAVAKLYAVSAVMV